MPLARAIGATVASGLWNDARINDDRLGMDASRGLFFVADASGPVYGGYHAPYAVDPGLAALSAAFDRPAASTRERLRAAFVAAHATMNEMERRYEEVRCGRVGLDEARRTADAVRPLAWRGYDSLAHFGASLTACALGDDGGVVLAQVGGCRAYSLKAGAPVLLVRDHTLPSVLEAAGASAEMVQRAREDHPLLVVQLLGMGVLQMNLVDAPAEGTIVLCTDGVYDEAVRALFGARTHGDVRVIVEACAKASRDDATAVVLSFA